MATGRVIVLTGATRGLGRALAEAFAAAGHRVLGCGRSGRQIDALRQQLGEGHDFDVVDVSDDARVATWSARLLRQFGPPDLLLNNAAVINHNALLWNIPREEFDYLIDVNIKGVANVIRHFVPAMVERGRGVIVNFSSYWGRSTAAEVAPYCASKWAIEGLTRALAQELPQGMAAVPFNPGVIATDMLRRCFDEAAESYPSAQQWARDAAPFLLRLGPQHNGKPQTTPGY
ncbi:MAG: SDR family oxidoreductase [Isosphaeraceae bacterium]|nr:SDR family oxidoreductase [Isosphaeraceae bacterium]